MQAVFIVAIVMASVLVIVRMSLKHDENIARIKHGYPTREHEKEERKKTADDGDFIDMTASNDKHVN